MEAESLSVTGAPAGIAPAAPSTSVVCRVLDVLVASVLVVLLLPLLVAIAVAIRLDSPGPSLFRQRRLGFAMEPFTVHKFRSMYHHASSDEHRHYVLELIKGQTLEPTTGPGDEPLYKLCADPRVTRVGRVLRRWSLDELPQLINVLRGEMSLVGPRPAISYEVDNYRQEWFERFNVKPGLTGLWQVSGRSELSFTSMMALDTEYAQRRSLSLNLWILVKTVRVVLLGKGAA